MAHTSGLLSLCIIFLLPLVFANPSPFEIIKKFEGCHKGQKLSGLSHVKNILAKFGYMDHHLSGDEFDDSLETALKTYQLNYHLNPTGTLDSKTIASMMMPRCSVPDIIHGLNFMRIGKNKDKSFFVNYSKWPISKSHLTYYIPANTSETAVRAIERAFKKWADATHFTFSPKGNEKIADLRVSFHTKDHGDNHPFDGPGGIVAHAWGPKNGAILHFDGDEKWSGSIGDGLVQGGLVQDGSGRGGSFDLETVALHGIGHLLGLGHSSVEDAIMYPSFVPGVSNGIHEDDLVGIKSIYPR